MPRFRVRELAEARGLNMSQLQIAAGVAMGTVRRYWYGTKDGKEHGTPLNEVDLEVLGKLAKPLGVRRLELIEDDRRARYAALGGTATA